MKKDELSRYRGALFGLAVGDAFGAPFEFKRQGEFWTSHLFLGGGTWGLEAGTWTDDTSMALCLADSLISCNGFNAIDQLERYARWYKEGYLSSIDRCIAIGKTTKTALESFLVKRSSQFHEYYRLNSGCGSLVRLAPIVMFYANRPKLVATMACESSQTTHGNCDCVNFCRYFSLVLLNALQGYDKKAMFEEFPSVGACERYKNPTPTRSFKTKTRKQIISNGHVASVLETALWAFYHTDSFDEGLKLVAELGGYTCSTGATYGQLAGAFYGFRGISMYLTRDLKKNELISRFSEELFNKRLEALPDKNKFIK